MSDLRFVVISMKFIDCTALSLLAIETRGISRLDNSKLQEVPNSARWHLPCQDAHNRDPTNPSCFPKYRSLRYWKQSFRFKAAPTAA